MTRNHLLCKWTSGTFGFLLAWNIHPSNPFIKTITFNSRGIIFSPNERRAHLDFFWVETLTIQNIYTKQYQITTMLRGDPSEAPQSLKTHKAQSQTWNLPKATKLIFTNHFKDNYKICEMIRAPKSLKTNIGNKPQRKLETLQQVPNQFSCNIYRKHYEINTTLRFNFSMAPKSLTKINVIQCKHWKLGNPKLWSVSRPSKTFRKLWSWVSRNIYKTNKLNQTDSHIESHAESHLRTSNRDVRLCKIEN